MPKKIQSENPYELFAKAPKESKFKCLLDQDVWRFQLNLDYRGDGKNLILSAKSYAHDNCLKCEVKRDGTDILFWYREPTTDEISGSRKLRQAINHRDRLAEKEQEQAQAS